MEEWEEIESAGAKRLAKFLVSCKSDGGRDGRFKMGFTTKSCTAIHAPRTIGSDT